MQSVTDILLCVFFVYTVCIQHLYKAGYFKLDVFSNPNYAILNQLL